MKQKSVYIVIKLYHSQVNQRRREETIRHSFLGLIAPQFFKQPLSYSCKFPVVLKSTKLTAPRKLSAGKSYTVRGGCRLKENYARLYIPFAFATASASYLIATIRSEEHPHYPIQFVPSSVCVDSEPSIYFSACEFLSFLHDICCA